MGPPPAYVSARGLTHAACSTTFGEDVQTGLRATRRWSATGATCARPPTAEPSSTPRNGAGASTSGSRAAYVIGAEGDCRERLGRGLTADELERVLLRYPGDV